MALQKRMAAALDEKDFEVAQIHDVTATVNKPDKKQNDTNLVSYCCNCLNIYCRHF